MASRCIQTLNDLDKISDRIFSKHSKGRFRAGIEAKLKAAREKAERSLRDIDEESPSCRQNGTHSCRSSIRPLGSTLSSRTVSTSVSTTSRSLTSEHQNKIQREKVHKPSSTKSAPNEQRVRASRRKTKSYPSCSIADETEEDRKVCNDHAPHTVSFFGKYRGKESEYKPTAWFNFPQETSFGVIDIIVCDEKNKEPVCFSVDRKKGESVPNPLRHNLPVRVGQNGMVRTEKKVEFKPETDDGNTKQGKKRTAPLNWEEQLNWHNACVVSSALQSVKDSSSKGLYESHSVTFHEKRAQQRNDSKRKEENYLSPAYKLSLETRWVYPDRRNLVSGKDKCITAVEIEDNRTDERVKVSEESTDRTKRDGKNNAEESAQHNEEIVSKKVSFEDERVTGKKTTRNPQGNDRGEKVDRKTKDVAIISKTNESEEVGLEHRVRPKTSQGGSRGQGSDVMAGDRKMRRPHSAPPTPPSTPRFQTESKFSSCMPITITIPTQGDFTESRSDSNMESRLSDEPEKSALLSASVSPGESEEYLVESESCTAVFVDITPQTSEKTIPRHVSLKNALRSAPVSRTTLRTGNETLRSKSSTALQRKPHRPPSPVVFVSESSLELPKDLPPAQAVVALRKKIREDLAQQNRELQLEIQHLYLKKHTE